jgi:uncharacterized phage protein (TIGR02220 family)
MMHHYPFHVGDYIRATAHLDLIEDCVYRRLIDMYMETEKPIPNDNPGVIRRLRLGSSGLILDSILREFFTLEGDNCWHNSRCDAEIQAYKRLAEVSRINGKLGGRPKKTQQVILANPEITQQEPSRLQPRTKNQEPISKEQTTLSGLQANTDGHCQINGKRSQAVEILEFLNTKAHRRYKPVDANLRLIAARLREHEFQPLKSMIAMKCREWINDEKMAQYLAPDTLFNATKCAKYVGQLHIEDEHD